MRKFLLVLIGIVLANSADAQERMYACSMAAVTGFNQDKGTQRRVARSLTERRFLLKFDGNRALIKFSGEPNALEVAYSCTRPFNGSPMVYHCNSYFNALAFDEKLLRFTYSSLYGYVDDSSDSIAVSYGDCQKF
jgi:hypothetical protein